MLGPLLQGRNLRELRLWWLAWHRRKDDAELRRLEIRYRRADVALHETKVAAEIARIDDQLERAPDALDELASPSVRELPRAETG